MFRLREFTHAVFQSLDFAAHADCQAVSSSTACVTGTFRPQATTAYLSSVYLTCSLPTCCGAKSRCIRYSVERPCRACHRFLALNSLLWEQCWSLLAQHFGGFAVSGLDYINRAQLHAHRHHQTTQSGLKILFPPDDAIVVCSPPILCHALPQDQEDEKHVIKCVGRMIMLQHAFVLPTAALQVERFTVDRRCR